MSRRLGLIIGVNQYLDTSFQPLQYAENDARALAQWLVNNKGGKWAPGDLQHLQGGHVTKELTESLIAQVCLNIAEPDDLVLLYFAGHTFVDERTGEGYLALANTRLQDPSTAIALSALWQHIMLPSRAGHILLLLDCFQSGNGWRTRRTFPFDFTPLLGQHVPLVLQQRTNRLLLASCRGNELAPEAGEQRIGLFINRTIVGLCGPASQTPDHITLRDLHNYLQGVLAEQHRSQLFGQEQTPLLLIGEVPSVENAQPVSATAPSQFRPFASTKVNGTRSSGDTLFKQSHSGTPAASQAGPVNSISTAQAENHSVAHAPSSAQLLQTAPEQQTIGLLQQAQQLFQLQQYPQALQTIDHILSFSPQESNALLLKAQILGTVGRLPEALTIVEQLIQINENNPLLWSMRAVILTNANRYQEALASIERALALDASNAESQAIRANILSHLKSNGISSSVQKEKAPQKEENRGDPRALAVGAVLQLGGLVLGIVGAFLPTFQPRLPFSIGVALSSFALSLLCVNAVRGPYRHGLLQLLFVFVSSILAAGTVGAIYLVGDKKIEASIGAQPTLLIPYLYLALWLIVAAAFPVLLGILGYAAGLLVRSRRKR